MDWLNPRQGFASSTSFPGLLQRLVLILKWSPRRLKRVGTPWPAQHQAGRVTSRQGASDAAYSRVDMHRLAPNHASSREVAYSNE